MVSVPTIEAIDNSEHEVICLISAPDAIAGRGRAITPNEFAQWANSCGRDVVKPENSAALNEILEIAKPDVVITIAYGKLIPEFLLNRIKYGWLNLHFSLLPRWRGAAPVQWAIKHRDVETGVTVFKLDKGMDTGPIFLKRALRISDFATTDSLLSELSILGSAAVLDTLDLLQGEIQPTPQVEKGVTLAPKISKMDGKIDWNRSNGEVDSHIRAMTHNPGAWTVISKNRLVINQAHPIEHDGKPGEIFRSEKAICIATSSGAIELEIVTPEGKREMNASDWFRGARIAVGTVCE